MYTAFLYEPIRRLHQLNQLVQAGRAAGERVFEILDQPIEPGWSNDRNLSGHVRNNSGREADSFPYKPEIAQQRAYILGDIRYENVSFSYAEGLPALKHVSFHAPPGATIALVGATGAGKSTLVNLLV